MIETIKTPGQCLKQVLDIYHIPQDELVKYALVSNEHLYNIINGTELIPISIALYLNNNYEIPYSWWQTLNTAYCIYKNRKYIGINIGYEMLINAIYFEKP